MVDIGALESGNVWKYIGMRVTRDGDGRLGVHVRVTDNLKQVYGNVHGGIIATAIDAAVAVAVNDHIGKDHGAATVELKVNFLRPVRDSDIFAYAKLVKAGRQLITGTTEVFDDRGNLVAIGIATYAVRPISDR